VSDSWPNTDSVQPAAAFRSGTEYLGHQLFGDGDCVVLVEPETVRSLREAAEQAAPAETGGLLYGRTGSDENGHYVLVSGFVQVSRDVSRPGGFNFLPGDTHQLRDRADHEIADEVGWWHSHTQPSPYTPVDLGIQGRFDWPDSVGLLVFAAGLQWAAAYLGPSAVDLGHPVELTEDERPALLAGEPGTVGTVSRLTGPLPQLPARAGRPPGPPDGRPPWLPRVRTVLIGVGVILAAVLVMAVIDLAGHVGPPHPYTPAGKSSSASPPVQASTPTVVPTTPTAVATTPAPPPATSASASSPAPSGVPTLAGSYCEEDEFAAEPGVYSCFANVQPPAWSSEVTWVSGNDKFLGSGIQVTIRSHRSETVYVIVGPISRPLAREPVSLSPN
jgi:proteasome lid subunit RPN8/RPN11